MNCACNAQCVVFFSATASQVENNNLYDTQLASCENKMRTCRQKLTHKISTCGRHCDGVYRLIQVMHSPSGIGNIALLCFDVLRSDKGRDSFTFYGAKLLKHSPSQRICRAKLKFVTHANIKLWHTELCGPRFDAIS